jgi:hypothetical protein
MVKAACREAVQELLAEALQPGEAEVEAVGLLLAACQADPSLDAEAGPEAMALGTAEGVVDRAGGAAALPEPDSVLPLPEWAAESDTVPLALREGVREALVQPEELPRPDEVVRGEGSEAGVALRRGLREAEGSKVGLELVEGVVLAEGQRELLGVRLALREAAEEGDCEPGRDAVLALLAEGGLDAVPDGLHEGWAARPAVMQGQEPAQAVGAVSAELGQTNPAGQVVQAAALAAPSAALNVPGGQAVAVMEKAGQKCPAGHSTGAPEAQK